MARQIDASHALQHPSAPDKILLLRQTTNPGDPAGAFAVLKVVTPIGYQKHYKEQCPLLLAIPTKVIATGDGNIDAVIIDDEDVPDNLLRIRQEHVSAMSSTIAQTPKTKTTHLVELNEPEEESDEPGLESPDESEDLLEPISRIEAQRIHRSQKSFNRSDYSKSIIDRFLSQFE